ncbi:hypothetical protein K7432_009763 [Basidiobolus ranarum]|uniref:PH domain-containing protein n=1 Tax=Basidiobolus ranarum TaxID=34480 RepID=A0ABR2VWZ7_9FUNG
MLNEINELKRVSRHRAATHGNRILQNTTCPEEQIEIYEQSMDQEEKSVRRSPELEETYRYGESTDSESIQTESLNHSSDGYAPSNESVYVNMYIPYTIPHHKNATLASPKSRIQPFKPDDSPIFKGFLYKLGSNRQWQKREFRTDGFMLVCLEKKKVKVQPKTIILAKYSTPDDLQTRDPELRELFYPTNPPLPHISHPLVATASPIEDSIRPGQYVEFYQPPKWIIPLSDILAVTLLARNGYKVKRCFVIYTSERKYILRAQTDMETACWVYLLKRMAEKRHHEMNALESGLRLPSNHSTSLIRINPINNQNPRKYLQHEEILDQ